MKSVRVISVDRWGTSSIQVGRHSKFVPIAFVDPSNGYIAVEVIEDTDDDLDMCTFQITGRWVSIPSEWKWVAAVDPSAMNIGADHVWIKWD